VSSSPSVSVVVPTFNRLPRLRETLVGLAGQVGVDDGFEVIVVSDGSTDGTDDYISSDQLPLPIIALTQPNGGPAAARNKGIAAASGELVLFIDDDVVPTPDLIAAHLRRHDHPDDDLVVVGPMETPEGYPLSPWVRWEQAMLYKQYEAMNRGDYGATARQFYTGNASVARRHLAAAGGFDPTFRRAEDVELAYRLARQGLHFAFEPQATVLHYAERSFDAWLQAAYSYGQNDVIFARERDQGWLLDSISREFHGRHRLVRALTSLCIPHRRAAAAASAVLAAVSRAVCRLPSGSRFDRLASATLSAVYNLTYYRGMADELGSGRELMARFDAAAGTV
jgi:GT2 family glycosyltransferase